MALPTKVVEQLSRAPARTPGWSSRVLLFSATFFILSLGIFLGIQFGYKPFLENQLEGLNKQIQAFSDQVPQDQQDQFITFYSQLSNLDRLLARQVQPSKIFPWLEKNTNTNIQWKNMSFNVNNSMVTVNGQTQSLVSLAEQLNRFRKNSDVRNTQLSQLSMVSGGGWNFSIALTLNRSIISQIVPSDDQTVPSEEGSGSVATDTLQQTESEPAVSIGISSSSATSTKQP